MIVKSTPISYRMKISNGKLNEVTLYMKIRTGKRFSGRRRTVHKNCRFNFYKENIAAAGYIYAK